MLHAVIKPEWAAALTEDEILKFNPEHGSRFLDTVDYRNMGGLALDLYKTAWGKGEYLVYDAEEQIIHWRHIARLDLAFGLPTFVAMPLHLSERNNDRTGNPYVAKTLEEYLCTTTPNHSMYGSEKLLIPLVGVDLVTDEPFETEPPLVPVPQTNSDKV
jgi:hypothetical protein